MAGSHPGFKAVARKIAAKGGYSSEEGQSKIEARLRMSVA